MPIKLDIRNQGDTLHLTLNGKLDEHFDVQAIAGAAVGSRKAVLHLAGVRSISSLGVRAFETLLRALEGSHMAVELDEISAATANQLTMIPTLLGDAKVRSAKLPFVCGACGAEALGVVPYEAGAAALHPPTCPSCGEQMELDGLAEEYLPH